MFLGMHRFKKINHIDFGKFLKQIDFVRIFQNIFMQLIVVIFRPIKVLDPAFKKLI